MRSQEQILNTSARIYSMKLQILIDKYSIILVLTKGEESLCNLVNPTVSPLLKRVLNYYSLDPIFLVLTIRKFRRRLGWVLSSERLWPSPNTWGISVSAAAPRSRMGHSDLNIRIKTEPTISSHFVFLWNFVSNNLVSSSLFIWIGSFSELNIYVRIHKH